MLLNTIMFKQPTNTKYKFNLLKKGLWETHEVIISH